MYMPQQFEESRPEVLHELIRSHPFGTLVVATQSELHANHLPFLLDPTRGPYGTLRGHVARANPVWKHLGGPLESIAIFQGAHAYITPNWYPSKKADGKVVPTWNYAAVHAYGQARAIEDRTWLLDLVTQLTVEHESAQAAPWRVADAPAQYIEQMLRAIVGIEMPIARLQGKWKVSQNRVQADRLGVVAGLEAQATEQSRAMAALVRERAQ
jgi:transcriptional regulator